MAILKRVRSSGDVLVTLKGCVRGSERGGTESTNNEVKMGVK